MAGVARYGRRRGSRRRTSPVDGQGRLRRVGEARREPRPAGSTPLPRIRVTSCSESCAGCSSTRIASATAASMSGWSSGGEVRRDTRSVIAYDGRGGLVWRASGLATVALAPWPSSRRGSDRAERGLQGEKDVALEIGPFASLHLSPVAAENRPICRDFPRWRDPDSNRGHHDFQWSPAVSGGMRAA
jgi:hypothetical protein